MAIDLNEGLGVMRRVETLLKERGLKLADFARRMGVTPAYVSNWRRRGLPADRLARAADVLQVSVDELLGRIDGKPDSGIPLLLTGKIPVVGKAQLGDDNQFAEVSYYDAPEGYVGLPSRDPEAYALRCVGDSMYPRIQDGEYVVAEPSIEPQPGDEVVVQDTDRRAMVKRYLYIRDQILHLGSINENYNGVAIPMKKVYAIHPVLAIIPKKLWSPCS